MASEIVSGVVSGIVTAIGEIGPRIRDEIAERKFKHLNDFLNKIPFRIYTDEKYFENAKKLLVVGSRGIGKTTLIKKLIEDLDNKVNRRSYNLQYNHSKNISLEMDEDDIKSNIRSDGSISPRTPKSSKEREAETNNTNLESEIEIKDKKPMNKILKGDWEQFKFIINSGVGHSTRGFLILPCRIGDDDWVVIDSVGIDEFDVTPGDKMSRNDILNFIRRMKDFRGDPLKFNRLIICFDPKQPDHHLNMYKSMIDRLAIKKMSNHVILLMIMKDALDPLPDNVFREDEKDWTSLKNCNPFYRNLLSIIDYKLILRKLNTKDLTELLKIEVHEAQFPDPEWYDSICC